MKKVDYYIPLYKDKIYHIYNRGNGKEKIFYNEDNYYYFLRQYYNYLYNYLETFAYCLLPNHFHLLIRVKNDIPEIMSERFRKFFISYSMSINIQQKRKGNLFQRGFKRKSIDDERYFYSAVYYIHANPVHHNLVRDLRNYKFSSYNILIGNDDTRLSRDIVIGWFGGRSNFINFHSDIKSDYHGDNYLIEDYT